MIVSETDGRRRIPMTVKMETRQVSGFNSISMRGEGTVYLDQASAPSGSEKVVIEADDALLQRIGSYVRDGRLILGFDLNWWEWITWWIDYFFVPQRSITYYVTVKEFQGISINGSGKVFAGPLMGDQCRIKVNGAGKLKFDNLKFSSLKTTISGSGDIELAGSSRRHEVIISGSGRVYATGFSTNETRISISGSGTTLVKVSDELEIRISGSGDVRYVGQPHITKSISGSGRVREIERMKGEG